MQQEDDLRALAKIMDFGRAVSIFIMVIHVYVYCYPSMAAWQLTLDVIDRILLNFDRTTGIFGCILWTKLLAVLLLAISCMGTIGVKGEKITWHRIWAVLTAGAVLFFLNWWLLDLPFPHEAVTSLYVLTLTAGYLCLLMAGLWISRLYRNNLMEDVFNQENESFMQVHKCCQQASKSKLLKIKSFSFWYVFCVKLVIVIIPVVIIILIIIPFMTLVFFRMVIPVVMVTIGTIMFVPISAMEINPVIKRIVVIASRSDTNFNQNTIPFPITFIIMADVTHVFAGSPCYFKG